MSDRRFRAAAAATGATLDEVNAIFDQVAIWRRYGIQLSLSADGAHVAVRFPSGVSDESREAVRSFVHKHKAALLILVGNEVWPASQVSNEPDQDYDYAANYDAGRGMVDLLTHDVRFMASLVGFLVDRAARRYVHEARYDLPAAQRHWNAALREVPPPEHPEAARRFKFGPDASQVETVVSWSLASEGDVDYDEDVDNPAGLARFEVDARPVIDQLQPSRRITGAKLEAWIAACEEPIYRLVAQVLDDNHDLLSRNFMFYAAYLAWGARLSVRQLATSGEVSIIEEAGCSPSTCGIDPTVPCLVENCGATLRHNSSCCRQPRDPDCLERLDPGNGDIELYEAPDQWDEYRDRVNSVRGARPTGGDPPLQ